MFLHHLKTEETVRRLQWVMAGAIIFSAVLTLMGQPDVFWQNPTLAMRGDGLSVNSTTNHTFEFFLANGWLPFLLTTVFYLLVMLLITAVLPRRIALVVIFSTIFGHYYGASNWLAVHWHLGLMGATYYGLVLAPVIAITAFNEPATFNPLNALRGVMLLAMSCDAVATVIGQPHGYLHNPLLVHEANPASRFFLQHGWYAYFLEQIVICTFLYRLTGALAKPWGNAVAWGYILAGFTGTSNWFFYEWRMGLQTVVAFGALLSFLITITTFASEKKRIGESTTSEEQVPDGRLCNMC